MFTKALLIFSCLLINTFAFSFYQTPPTPVPILASRSESFPDGSYEWSYESKDGSSQEQSGQVGPNGGQNLQGEAKWVDPKGVEHILKYVADENGYQPLSDDIPQPPAIPEAIIKALEWNAAHQEK